jgi:mono/diheme cytochrome c family protein
MVKLGFAALVAAFVATLAVVTVTGSGSAEAAAPCKAKKIETKFLADACKAGGQKGAKDAMKKAMKTWKKKGATVSCASCHTQVGGAYPLKTDGLKMYKDLGGV